MTSGLSVLAGGISGNNRNVGAIDLDEVEFGFVDGFLPFTQRKFPEFWEEHGPLTRQNFVKYRLSELLGIEPSEEAKMVLAFYDSPDFRELPLIDGAFDGSLSLRRLGYDLVAVTSRPQSARESTSEMLERHFSGVFSDIYFSSGNSSSDQPMSKGEICNYLGARFLVDDDPGYCKSAQSNGVAPILMGAPWNQNFRGTRGIHYAENWEQVVDQVARLRG